MPLAAMGIRLPHRPPVAGVVAVLLLLVLAIAPGGSPRATTVRGVTIDEMLAQCELVFEGQVVSREARQDPGTGLIHTIVTFQVLDVLKGGYTGDTVALRFLGGTVGDTTLVLGDMRIPAEGERGIYFVESLHRRQAHPLYGWSQGHFLVVPDAQGVERVLTESRRPVSAVASGSRQQARPLSDGIAAGLTVTQSAQSSGAMTLGAFKKQLATMLRALP